MKNCIPEQKLSDMVKQTYRSQETVAFWHIPIHGSLKVSTVAVDESSAAEGAETSVFDRTEGEGMPHRFDWTVND